MGIFDYVRPSLLLSFAQLKKFYKLKSKIYITAAYQYLNTKQTITVLLFTIKGEKNKQKLP